MLPAIGVFPPWGESMVGFDRALLLDLKDAPGGVKVGTFDFVTS